MSESSQSQSNTVFLLREENQNTQAKTLWSRVTRASTINPQLMLSQEIIPQPQQWLASALGRTIINNLVRSNDSMIHDFTPKN